MLSIREIRSSDLMVSVETDPYIPIDVRTYSSPIGAVYYRVGNFETSLVEIPISPISGTVRGITVVSVDRVGTTIDESKLDVISGLPIAVQESIPQRRQDDQREVALSLTGNRLVIDWSGGQQLDIKAVHGRLGFFIGGGVLLAAAIESLTHTEQQSLLVHLHNVSPPLDA